MQNVTINCHNRYVTIPFFFRLCAMNVRVFFGHWQCTYLKDRAKAMLNHFSVIFLKPCYYIFLSFTMLILFKSIVFYFPSTGYFILPFLCLFYCSRNAFFPVCFFWQKQSQGQKNQAFHTTDLQKGKWKQNKKKIWNIQLRQQTIGT